MQVQNSSADQTEAFSVPTLGGTPRLLAQDTACGIGISPDGKNMTFVSGHTAPWSQLFIARVDGSGKHVLLDLVKSNLEE
jgi:hypothetical protein